MENSAARIKAWSQFLRVTRAFFRKRGYTEVTTPSIVPSGAFEATLETLKVHVDGQQLELHTSPEMAMKEQLALLRQPIYQICHCFRDDPHTATHRKEFTMLEFYEPEATYREMQTLMRDFLNALSGRYLATETLTMREFIQRATQVDIVEADTAEKLREAVKKTNLHLNPEDTWEDIYFKLLLEKVEPTLDPEVVTFVTDYPAQQFDLAARSADGSVTERFEIYWKGMELCNGATELTDVEELNRRYQLVSERLHREKKKAHPYPTKLAETMPKLPPCAGVAVGMDRLFKALVGFDLV